MVKFLQQKWKMLVFSTNGNFVRIKTNGSKYQICGRKNQIMKHVLKHIINID